MTNKGRTYELSLKNDIVEHTTEDVVAFCPDYSGNSKHSVADLVVVWNDGFERHVAFVEAKKRECESGNRCSDVLKGSKTDETGRDELDALVEGTPPWAGARLLVSFDNREVLSFSARLLHAHFDDSDHVDDYSAAIDHDVRFTDGDNLSVRKPTLDEWNSARGGVDDWRKLLDDLGVPDYCIERAVDTDASDTSGAVA